MGRRNQEPEAEVVLFARNASGPAAVAEVWELLLDAFGSRLQRAEIDAYPAPSWEWWSELPVQVQQAQRALARRGEQQKRRKRADHLMAIELDLTAPDDLQLLRVFGPWSINADAYDRDRQVFLNVNDSGLSCRVELSAPDAVEFEGWLERRGLHPNDHFVTDPAA